jgi:hypothetical protein
LEVSQTTRVLRIAGTPIQLPRRANNPIVPHAQNLAKICENKAEKRCHPHAAFLPMESRSFCSNRARVRWCCCVMAGRNITGLIGAKRVGDMERVLPNLRQKLIVDGAGHWIQQERPDQVNAVLIAFLKESAV